MTNSICMAANLSFLACMCVCVVCVLQRCYPFRYVNHAENKLFIVAVFPKFSMHVLVVNVLWVGFLRTVTYLPYIPQPTENLFVFIFSFPLNKYIARAEGKNVALCMLKWQTPHFTACLYATYTKPEHLI